ncbi:SHOCT domain-containing protein [Nocardiopsis sp. LOL_012]|uniref:SHOCT domain-containing protein n=1 Tax=Nocardiopsis sp. LOL_012 TaxID=3345409 RepID=UPI003A8459C9
MPIGESKTRAIRWPSVEFLNTLDAVYKRQNTNLAARMVEHAMADIERDGTPEEKTLAREHLDSRARRGPKPKTPQTPAPTPAAELKEWAARLDEGLITREEYAAKKTQLLDL